MSDGNDTAALEIGQYRARKSMPEYRAWLGMKVRCNNKNSKSYKDYGGRGVRVCAEWMHDFLAFYKHIGPKPSDDYSIERIDTNGNYEPGNVRWATDIEQARNTRANVLLTHDGITATAAEWAERLDMHPPTIYDRLARKWPIEKVLDPTPHDRVDNLKWSHGEEKTQAKLTDDAVREIRRNAAIGISQRELARRHGVSRRAIQMVIQKITWSHIS